jgi:hypothetical protein
MAKTPPPTSDPKLWTVAEISKHTGVGIGDINQAIKEGCIPKAGKATYEPGRAIKGLFAFFSQHRAELPVFDNVEQCSGATGIPVSLIKAIRRTSKEPFKNQRIHLGPLLREIFADQKEDQDGEALGDAMKKKYDGLLAKVRYEDAIGVTLNKDEASAAIGRAVSQFLFWYDRLAELEAPASLKGKDETGIRQWMVDTGKVAKDQLRVVLAKYMLEEGRAGVEGDQVVRP